MKFMIVNRTGSGFAASSGCCSGDNLSSIQFFSQMTDKLSAMVTSLKQQFDEAAANCNGKKANGAILASTTVPSVVVGVRLEYLEYIKRFGPPPEGKFDEQRLIQLRYELGIES